MPHRKYLKKIQKEFPNHKWKSFKFLTHGWDHDVIILDNKWVFRFPKNNYAKKLFKNELRLMRFLNKKLTINIPNYTYIAKDKSFAGYKYMKGKEFKPWIYKNKVKTKNKRKIMNQFIKFYNEVHAINPDIFKKFEVKDFDPKKDLLKLYRNVKKLVYPKFNKKEIQITDEFFAKIKALDLKNVQNVFVHGDIHYSNMIIKEDYSELSGIIDFTDRIISDPALEFAYLWDYGPKFVKEVYKKYKGPKDPKFLYRSKLYKAWDAFGMMVESFKKKHRADFKEGYDTFTKLFRL
ncbi:aminoglycoside phosphotransferase family protein [Patescibacteria group bacterium]